MDVVLKNLESIAHQDIGKRGIENIVDEGGFQKALTLLSAAKSVAIITGFSIPPTETDGPLGAFAMIKALLFFKKTVCLVTDESNENMLKKSLEKFGFAEKVKLFIFPNPSAQDNPNNENGFSMQLALNIINTCSIDHIVAIERPAVAHDGHCYSMRARDLSAFVGHTHCLFSWAKKLGISTTGIGDGGNELGMGKLYDLVKQYVPLGEKIGCSVAADNVIVCGVSNWGGYAVSCGLFLMNKSATLAWNDCIPSPQEDFELLKFLVSLGCIDGIRGKAELFIDGFEYFPTHANILQQMIDLVK